MYTKFIQFLFILILPLFILLGALHYLASNPNTYMRGYDQYKISDETGIRRDDLFRITHNFIDYMYGSKENLQLRARVNGEERDIFNKRELLHMVDVKNLIRLGLYAFFLLFIVGALLSFLIYKKEGLIRLIKLYMWSSGISLISIPVLYLLLPKDFNSLFTLFHEVFFTNDLWLLDINTDILLQLHPLAFFLDIALQVGIIFVVINVINLMTGQLFIKFAQRKAPS